MQTVPQPSIREFVRFSFKTTLMVTGLSLAALGALQAQTNCVVPPSGLVSWWKAESNTLDTADSNNGTLAGNTTYGPGRVGNGFVFDGNGDAVTVGNPTNLQLQNFTIEAWIKRSSATLATLNAVNPQGSACILYGSYGGYGFGLWNDGRIHLTKIGYSAVISAQAVTDTNNFHHVAVTKSGSRR